MLRKTSRGTYPRVGSNWQAKDWHNSLRLDATCEDNLSRRVAREDFQVIGHEKKRYLLEIKETILISTSRLNLNGNIRSVPLHLFAPYYKKFSEFLCICIFILLECDFFMFVYISLLDGLREISKRKMQGWSKSYEFLLV